MAESSSLRSGAGSAFHVDGPATAKLRRPELHGGLPDPRVGSGRVRKFTRTDGSGRDVAGAKFYLKTLCYLHVSFTSHYTSCNAVYSVGFVYIFRCD